jgi:hypothetical protein
MRVLVVDDMKERHDGFLRIFAGHEVAGAYRYTHALDALRNKGPWGLVCLDHDLADADDKADSVPEGIGGRYFFTGLDLAFWLRDNPQFCPPKVLIHSWNPDGAKNMEAVLRTIPNVEVTRRQYGGALLQRA